MTTSFHENRSVGLLLTFIGGMMDSYTYIRYSAFASAQTGNIILAIFKPTIGSGAWVWEKKNAFPPLFFFIGILYAKFMIDYSKRR